MATLVNDIVAGHCGEGELGDGTHTPQLRSQIRGYGGSLQLKIVSINVTNSRLHRAGSWSAHAADGGSGGGDGDGSGVCGIGFTVKPVGALYDDEP